MKIYASNGSVLVEHPTEALKKDLCWFRRSPDGDGQYEYLYSLNAERDMLVTMPGFAELTRGLCPKHRFRDQRIPLPDPDMDSGMHGVEFCRGAIAKAVKAGGGTVAVPDVMRPEQVVGAILRAYPRSGLLDRGTPLSIVAVDGMDNARRVASFLRDRLRGRDVEIGSGCDSEDVIVVSAGVLNDAPRNAVGLLVGVNLRGEDRSVAEAVSGFRTAARWNILSTPWGGMHRVLDMPSEGLFGPVVSSVTYDDAVKAGVAMPVTVCWLPCPEPRSPDVSAPLEVLSARAMQDNAPFVRIVRDVFRGVSGDTGCILTGMAPTLKRLARTMPEEVFVHEGMSARRRKIAMDDIAGGSVRKAILSGTFPDEANHRVVVLAECGGADAVRWFPSRRRSDGGGNTFIVDFLHKWDVHNGRHGRLLLNDEARARRYAEMGFSQICMEDAGQLPFL